VAISTAAFTISGPVASVYTVHVDTNSDLALIDNEAQITHIIYVKASFAEYGNTVTTYTQYDIIIDEVVCDCQYLAWDSPSAQAGTLAVGSTDTITIQTPTANTAATASVNAFKKCYQAAGSCATTG
jgi:hypothetical protein